MTMQVIRGGRVLDAGGHSAEPGDILVDGDTIREIGPPGMPAPEAVEIDAGGQLLMPGLVNAHTHGSGNLSKAQGDRWTLELMLNSMAAIGGRRTLEDRYLSTLIGAVEMIRKGCTATLDLQFEFRSPTRESTEAVALAYVDAGMRAVVAPMVWEHTLYEVVPGLYDALSPALQAEADKFRLPASGVNLDALEEALKNWKFDRAQVAPAVSPSIPHHCSEDLLVRLRDMARDYDIGFHTHLCESKVQALTTYRLYGKTLTARLADLDILGPHFTAAHAVWVDADDIGRLADAGASVSHNPGSNARLGNGIAPVRDMLDRGVNVAIGTDSCTCSDNLNMFEAMRFSSFLIRLQELDYRRWPEGETILSMATAGGARALGFGDAIGVLAPGRKADIVFLDLARTHYVPLNDPTLHVVYAEDGTGVAGVMIGGRMVLDRGRLVTVDEAKLVRDAERAIDRLLGEANEEMRERAELLHDVVGQYCLGLARESYHIDRHARCHSDPPH